MSFQPDRPNDAWMPQGAQREEDTPDPDTDPYWPDDYTPEEGRNSTKWPEDWSKEKIAEEAKQVVDGYVDDWGWELHKYARNNNDIRVRKTLRYEIHLEEFDGCAR